MVFTSMFFVVRNSQTAHVGDRAHTADCYAVHTGHLLQHTNSYKGKNPAQDCTRDSKETQHKRPAWIPSFFKQWCKPAEGQHAQRQHHKATDAEQVWTMSKSAVSHILPPKRKAALIPKDGAAPWYHLASQTGMNIVLPSTSHAL